jgi:predicted Zn-dependent protease
MKYLACALLALLLGGCASHEVVPLTSGNAVIGSDDDEIKIFEESNRAHQELRDKGLILNDPEITAYLNAVLERIKPANLPDDLTISVAAVRDPVVNAYAFPNGDIYINIGLLARLDNEAQLAHITAHELAHVVQRHGLAGLKDRRDKIVAANITDLFLFGTSIAYIPYIASISSYSRSQEEEADKLALDWMSAGGYPLSSTAGLFDILQEIKVEEAAINSVYSSHPHNRTRASYTREYIETHNLATNPQASAGADAYGGIRAALTLQTISLQLINKHYELARDSADRELRHDPDNPWLYYYRGDRWAMIQAVRLGNMRGCMTRHTMTS